jgi:hypothetical protein
MRLRLGARVVTRQPHLQLWLSCLEFQDFLRHQSSVFAMEWKYLGNVMESGTSTGTR